VTARNRVSAAVYAAGALVALAVTLPEAHDGGLVDVGCALGAALALAGSCWLWFQRD